MGREPSDQTLLGGLLDKMRRRKPAEAPAPSLTPLGMLERLHGGEDPDYCLYLRPAGFGETVNSGPLSVNLEEMLARAFEPLPIVMLDENADGAENGPLPDESFLTLANRARVLCLAPTSNTRFISRLRIIKAIGPLSRCIFIMPENQTLGKIDWLTTWPTAKDAIAPLGIELSGYTPGGWLFRIDKEGKAVTFRPIVNPNPEKIARALEGICAEME